LTDFKKKRRITKKFNYWNIFFIKNKGKINCWSWFKNEKCSNFCSKEMIKTFFHIWFLKFKEKILEIISSFGKITQIYVQRKTKSLKKLKNWIFSPRQRKPYYSEVLQHRVRKKSSFDSIGNILFIEEILIFIFEKMMPISLLWTIIKIFIAFLMKNIKINL
jgi:hypothetical protein